MIIDNYPAFLDRLNRDLEDRGVDVSSLYLDHIAYQCSSDTDYDSRLPEAQKLGILISENIVNDRRVGIIQLTVPLAYKDRSIPAIELVAPKPNQVCPSELEHAEFVIPEGFAAFMAKYPQLSWDTSAINQPVFPMIKLDLSGTTRVKFHSQAVLDIIKS